MLFSIFMINIVLSGDNALVIALASRNLPSEQKKQAILLGSAGAIILRSLFSLVAVYLLSIPYLRLAGGILLLWIAVKLIANDEHEDKVVEGKGSLWGAVWTIVVADVAMSFDNVIAIAGAAKGHFGLIMIGLLISIPLIIWGSNFISMLIKKWPIVIILGAGILGWTAGEMIIAENELNAIVNLREGFFSWAIPGLCTLAVVLFGIYSNNRVKAR